MAVSGLKFPFDNSYSRLPERFFARLSPAKVPAPRLIKLNAELARTLGLDPDALSTEEWAEVFSGNRAAEGAEPMALAYAGHQFGHFVPVLGDGRANLMGEVVTPDGKRYDIQLKGSGPTPFSRRGDGKAALGPVLREYIVSEAMAALGVPTTRALAAVTSGEEVFRETVLPGAIFTRVAASHLRVGTFQYFAAKGDIEGLRVLADYAIARHYTLAADAPQRFRAFLGGVISRQAKLVAQWMSLGFIHGVMNTDNTSISGETIDYGPCAFMEAYDPAQVYSSIDQRGRYSYQNQPVAMHWNLTRLAEALLPLLVEEAGSEEAGLLSANTALAAYEPQYQAAHRALFSRKLGLTTRQVGDDKLIQDLLDLMATHASDFTLTFRRLSEAAATASDDAITNLFSNSEDAQRWVAAWRHRLGVETQSQPERTEAMRAVNPIFIPRNHLVQAAIEAAELHGDYRPFEDLLRVTASPFEYAETLTRFALPADPHERVSYTFCGT